MHASFPYSVPIDLNTYPHAFEPFEPLNRAQASKLFIQYSKHCMMTNTTQTTLFIICLILLICFMYKK
jgi:hypothetical protein